MKTIYFTACSLDGYIADKNNSLEWLFQFEAPKDNYIENFVDTIGALAMGSHTYEWLLNHLKANPNEKWYYNFPSFVFTSRKLPAFPGADIRFVNGDVRPVHEKMLREAKGKDLWIVGGGELVGKFYDADLLNELIIQMASTTLGGGAPLFPRQLKKPFHLESVKQLAPEFVEMRYRV
jgi:dihydrofolate reductase